MNEEITQIMKELLKRPSFFGKIKYNIHLLELTSSDIENIKKTLIHNLKPFITDFWLKRKNVNIIDKLAVQVFEERINTLPKKSIVELYNQLERIKNAESEEAKTFLYEMLMINFSLHYSLDGWFIKRVLKYARTRRYK